MPGSFKVATISYKNAPLEIRERLVLDDQQISSFYKSLKQVLPLNEAIIISTCNRTEIYYRSEKALTREIVKLLAELKAVSANEALLYFEEILITDNTIKYLFEMSAGLHSQIIGDLQIISQIKNAYQLACDAQMAGPFLHKLLQAVFVTNKRIVQETGFRDGAASTTFVTLEIIESFIYAIPSPKILIIGTGEVGADMAKTMVERGILNISISNRTYPKAQQLAKELSIHSVPIENISYEDFNIIISSVRVPEPIIDTNTSFSRHHHTYLFDLAMPRSVSPALDHYPHLVLYRLEEIQKRVQEGVSKRTEEIPSVKRILSEVNTEFNQWSREQLVTPTIQSLKSVFDKIRLEELQRYENKCTPEEKELIEQITNNILQKTLKLPVLKLKAACKKGDHQSLIETINALFDLPETGKNE